MTPFQRFAQWRSGARRIHRRAAHDSCIARRYTHVASTSPRPRVTGLHVAPDPFLHGQRDGGWSSCWALSLPRLGKAEEYPPTAAGMEEGVRFGKQRKSMAANPLLHKAALGRSMQGHVSHASALTHGRKTEPHEGAAAAMSAWGVGGDRSDWTDRVPLGRARAPQVLGLVERVHGAKTVHGPGVSDSEYEGSMTAGPRGHGGVAWGVPSGPPRTSASPVGICPLTIPPSAAKSSRGGMQARHGARALLTPPSAPCTSPRSESHGLPSLMSRPSSMVRPPNRTMGARPRRLDPGTVRPVTSESGIGRTR